MVSRGSLDTTQHWTPGPRFSWLPVTEDVDEAPFVYSFLADLVEANNPHILGANNSRWVVVGEQVNCVGCWVQV